MSLYACSGNSNANATTQEVIQQKEVIVDVTANQFKDLIAKEGTILDVRTPEEWAEGTVPNAEKINYNDDDFATQIERLDKTKPVFVYCKRGGRSASAAEILKEKGFTKVYNLDGGITAWMDEGNEVVK
ncbi:MAG: rhodanese-like domain-containing protein [Flavobacteriales bacterium]|nr:rhodanese-like domain-containing protein [Flavobacteriales bacterium]MCB9363463.1 rhodanese-like domain-containing protein [Flavobacteriales bacterium]